MTIAYFLTGSYNNVDHDFELIIQICDHGSEGARQKYTVILKDLASENSLAWQSAQESFLLCLKDQDNL